jgi:hypothetical protein
MMYRTVDSFLPCMGMTRSQDYVGTFSFSYGENGAGMAGLDIVRKER